MLEIYAKEFCAVGVYLKEKSNLHKGFILVNKKELEGMLNKNRYDTVSNKLHIWKNLKWIDTEADRRFTKRIYDRTSNTYRPYIKINAAILEQLNQLLKK